MTPSPDSGSELAARPISVALVNNMPDSAFLDTEDQFRGVASAGLDGAPGDLQLYTITEIPRSESVSAMIEARYRGLDQLWMNPPDALIVTGTEPAQVQLSYEPYWPYLARLLEWAATAVPTTLLSCSGGAREHSPVRRDRSRGPSQQMQRRVRRPGHGSIRPARSWTAGARPGSALTGQRRPRGGAGRGWATGS